jgi:uncharacterized membrane protein YfcA
MDARIATAASLAVVAATAAAGTVRFARRREVAWRDGILFALPSFVGVFVVRRWLLPALPERIVVAGYGITSDQLVLGAFAIVMLVAGIAMLRPIAKTPAPAEGNITESNAINGAQGEQSGESRRGGGGSPLYRALLIGAEGLLVGAVTGFVGAGGGFLIVPALTLLVGLDMKIAVGTSLFIIALKSLVGFGGDLLAGAAVPWDILAGVLAAALVGMAIGSRLASRVPSARLAKAFGVFVLVMGILILAKETMGK